MKRLLNETRTRQMLTYNNVQLLSARYADAPGLTSSELKVFSQNGEDGVIAAILARIGIAERWFVEFGIGAGIEGNCVFLADVMGWNGLFIESDPDGFAGLERKYGSSNRVRVTNSAVTAENLASLLSAADVPEGLDILSIDIDGNDYWVWKSLTAYSPRVVIIEYNGSLPLDERLVQPYNPTAFWDNSGAYGASLAALKELAGEKGYSLVHTELSGNNAFFVRNDLASAFDTDGPVERAANYGLQGHTHLDGGRHSALGPPTT
jgi:hypothetical protein